MNNRRINQEFFEKNLGLKTVLEEAAFVELAGHNGEKTAQVVLVESPSMRTRAVEGVKKHKRTALYVANPAEIESLLARGASFTKLYKGNNGFAFESVSPEGDCFLLHSEDVTTELQEVAVSSSFEALPDFVGLTDVTVSEISIHTPDVVASQAFYQTVLPHQEAVRFYEAQGPDLLCEATETWDLDSLRVKVPADMNWAELEGQLKRNYFKDKKETFIQTTDPSNIEIWFEK